MTATYETDYYRTLGVAHDATTEEMRTAYRKLAKQFHPDTAEHSHATTERFAAITEAYEVLSSPERRAAYDAHWQEHGYDFGWKRKTVTSPQGILKQAEELRHHMQHVDHLRMNHEALCEFVLRLLDEENLQLLEGETAIRKQVFERVFESVQALAARFIPELETPMQALVKGDDALQEKWTAWSERKALERRWNTYRPLLALVAAGVICIMLWLLARH